MFYTGRVRPHHYDQQREREELQRPMDWRNDLLGEAAAGRKSTGTLEAGAGCQRALGPTALSHEVVSARGYERPAASRGAFIIPPPHRGGPAESSAILRSSTESSAGRTLFLEFIVAASTVTTPATTSREIAAAFQQQPAVR